MYGRRLTDKDYEDLLACKTVPEVANYLKNETVYSEILSGLNENDVHRGQLETLLRKKIFYEKVSLARFDMNSEKFLSVFFINRIEIEQIKSSYHLALSVIFGFVERLSYIGSLQIVHKLIRAFTFEQGVDLSLA